MEPIEYRFEIRTSKKEDMERVFELVKELADFQNMLEKFTGSKEDLEKWTFGEHKLLYIYCGWLCPVSEDCYIPPKMIGYTIHFLNYSTFKHIPGIYLEDIYVQPEYRGKGYGKALLLNLCKIAKDNEFDIVEWQVLDSNKSSIDFYESMGAKPIREWVQYRLSGENTKHCAMEFDSLNLVINKK
ncbi:HAG group protein [Heterostelium album PN500]|uniref:HAG group protein n=1 Tax=Heterostelium pallidum (strain ATCC 26659 / Pp 5 / PN500) TaxID=670386 RepID=D3B458_HETP5|nr:HAG group protein [Heterostelium album PN500]EFA84106.1 HAG group protein [Heterostelium album PN500]|eukprot:XP_020436223.1 HAG group protein [Heterostelium album PN500]